MFILGTLKMRFLFIVLFYVLWNISANCMEQIPLKNRDKRKVVIYEDQWLVQKLDHFNPNDKRTWKQRYQINSDYHEKDGPIFLLIAGESEIKYYDLISERLTWIQYAKEFKALCLQLEHRFYGKSIPINVVSVESLKYLSVKQALADVGEFATYIQSKYSFPYKLIVFGGSYPASLAVWARMQYPNLIHGAMVSSPTLNVQVENHESIELLKEVLSAEDRDCVTQIRKAVHDLNAYYTTNHGAELIKEKFNICQSPNMFTELERAQLFLSLRKSFVYAVKFNKSSLFNIKHVCDIMVNDSMGEPITRFKEVNLEYLNREKLNCLENSKYIEKTYTKRLTSWDNFTIQNDDYFKMIEQSLSSYSAKCITQIKEAERVINFAFKSKFGANIIRKIFKLCNVPNRISEKSRQFFFHDLMISFYKAAQYNRIFSFNPSHVCGIMTDQSLGKPFDRLAKIFRSRIEELDCYNYDYDFRIEYLKPRPNQVLRTRQAWQFQVCSEFGNFAVANRRDDLFEANVPLQFYEGVCVDLFGRLYTAKELAKRQEQIKNLYIKLTDNRIVVVQGSHDVASYQKNATTIYEGYFNLIVMEGMAHSIDWSIRDGDSEIKRANRDKLRFLMKWLGISHRMLPRDELK